MKASLPDIVHALGQKPDTEMVVTLPALTVGRFRCRQVRVLLAAAELDGLGVSCREERGWLESVFVIRMTGRGRLLRRYLGRLLALSEDA